MTYAAGSSAVPVWSNRLRLEEEPLVVPESERMEAGATISDLRYGRLGVKVGSGVLDFVAVITRVGVHTGVNVTVGVTGVLEGVRLTVGVIGVWEGVSEGGTGVLVTEGVIGVFEGVRVTDGVTGVCEGVKVTEGVIGVWEGVSDGGTGVLVTEGVMGVLEGVRVTVGVIGVFEGATVAVAVGKEAISIRCTKTSGDALVSFGTRLDE